MEVKNGEKNDADFVSLVSRSDADLLLRFYRARYTRLSGLPRPTADARKSLAGDRILFSRDDILGGMNVFQRYGLMEYGSVYGHGAYSVPISPPSTFTGAELLAAYEARRPAVFQRASGLPPNCTKTLTTRRKMRLPGVRQEHRHTK